MQVSSVDQTAREAMQTMEIFSEQEQLQQQLQQAKIVDDLSQNGMHSPNLAKSLLIELVVHSQKIEKN